MAVLHVYLLDGFAEDVVVVEGDGREVARRAGVTSRLLEGHAATLDVPVPDGRSSVRVSVPSRAAAAAIDLELSGETHLLATFDEAGLKLWTTDAAPGFA